MFGYSNSLVAGAFLAALVSACSPLSSSSIRTGTMASPYVGQVRVTATWVPPGARQLGLVQATGTGVRIDEIMPEFTQRVAELGGDLGKVDRIRTLFEMQTRHAQQSYNCGSAQHPRTCTRMTTQTVEVAVTTVEGRAFTTRDPVPATAPAWAPPPDGTVPAWPAPQEGATPAWPVPQDSSATPAPPPVPPQPPQASP